MSLIAERACINDLGGHGRPTRPGGRPVIPTDQEDLNPWFAKSAKSGAACMTTKSTRPAGEEADDEKR
jgi:hypothetical protein